MTNIYLFNAKELSDTAKYERALPYLSAERLKQLSRLKHQEDKLRCVAAGYLLRRALASFDIDAANAVYRLGEFGKPYLLDNDIFFSISHSGNAVICAVSDKSEVGCDVEHKVNLKIAPRFFSCGELEALHESASPSDTFLRIWTLKESFIKYSGKGLAIPLSSFEMILSTPPHCQDFPDLNFAEFEFHDGYRAAVCTKDEISQNVNFISFE